MLKFSHEGIKYQKVFFMLLKVISWAFSKSQQHASLTSTVVLPWPINTSLESCPIATHSHTSLDKSK